MQQHQGKVFFHPIEGSASLTISWTPGPKGDAVEAKRGAGVGFFSDKGDLLCVIFDEVQSTLDQQILEFPGKLVEITVKNGRVKYTISADKPKTTKKKNRVRHRQPT